MNTISNEHAFKNNIFSITITINGDSDYHKKLLRMN